MCSIQQSTYQQIKDGTLKIAQTPGLNELFSLAQGPKGLLAGAPGRLPNLLWRNKFFGKLNVL